MLDADEYVVIKDRLEEGARPDLRAFLKPFESHGGIVVGHACFFSCGGISQQYIQYIHLITKVYTIY